MSKKFENNAMKKRWDSLHSDSRFRPQYPHEQVVRWTFRCFEKIQDRPLKILDLGCGAGRHSIFFSTNGFKTFATDISEEGIRALNQRALENGVNIETNVTSADDLACYPSSFFDGVCSFAVLYYLSLKGAKKAISEVHRILKPGGKFLLVVRTDEDSRCTNQFKISECTWRISELGNNAPSNVEVGMTMLFFNETDIAKLLAEKFNYTLGKMSFELGDHFDTDWVLFCEKRV